MRNLHTSAARKAAVAANPPTVIINNREYVVPEFTQAELDAEAVEMYGEGFDLAYTDIDLADFWTGVRDQLILDRNAGKHPAYGFRFATKEA